MYEIIKGDCLEEMKKLENESVDLILTDPPYGTINGMEIGHKTIKGKVLSKRNDWDVVVNIEEMLEEFKRVLRPNGKAIIFGNNGYTQDVRNHSNSYLNYVYPLYWIKSHFSSPLSAKVAPVSYVEDISVFNKNYGENKQQREYMKKINEFIDEDFYEKSEKIGLSVSGVRRFWHTDKQFRLPSKNTYLKIIEVYGIDKEEWFKPYEELEKLEREEHLSPTFNLPEGKGHAPNIFEVSRDNYGKNALHPTQKPVELMEQLIEIYSNEGDVVLDAFMGSGSTGVACINTNRKFIGIELDDEYFGVSEQRLKKHESKMNR